MPAVIWQRQNRIFISICAAGVGGGMEGIMLIMAVDYGQKHTGIAFSDISGRITGRAFVIDEQSERKMLERVIELIEENKPERIVVGYPKNMNGSIGPRAELSAAFAKQIEQRTGMQVKLWDERLTTVDAHRILAESGKNAKKRKKTVDAVAAALILEGYMGSL